MCPVEFAGGLPVRMVAARKILVTGADGFIGSHLVELLVKSGHRVRALVYYNAFDSRGWLDQRRARRARRARRLRRRRARSPRRAARDAGLRSRDASRRPDRHSLFLSRARQLRRYQREGNVERPAGGAGARRRARHPHLDERGLRNRAVGADSRGAPHPPAVAVRRHQGGGRPARAVVPRLVRDCR